MTEKASYDANGTDEKPTAGPSRRDFLAGTGAATAATLLGSGQVAADTSTTGNRVIGYYPSWAGSDYTPSDIPFGTITALNYAFLEPQSDGTVTLGNSDPAHIQAVSDNSDGDTDLLFSISGGWYPQEYSDAASTTTNRQRFARTAVDHVVNYGFDGIDLDWEYPDGTTRASDPDNFALLIQAVRNELDARVGTDAPLTIAASANPTTADDAYLDGIFDDLSYVHVMTYDYHGDWSTYTNFNAPLHSGPDSPTGQDWNVSTHMQYWAGRPIANDDLVMGIPFYGRVFEGVRSDQNNGLYQEFSSESAEIYYVIENELKSDPKYDYYWHSDAKVPWLYKSRGRSEFITYDDENSVATKMDFVLNNGFGGAFCWELSQDPSDTLLGVMHNKLH